MFAFWGKGKKPEYQEEKLLEQSREPTDLTCLCL